MRSIWHYGSCAPTLGAFSQSRSLCSSASLGKDLKTAIYKNHFRHLWEDNNLPLTGTAINREPFNLHPQALKGQLVWQYSYTLNDGRRTAATALLHHSGAVLTKQTSQKHSHIYMSEHWTSLFDLKIYSKSHALISMLIISGNTDVNRSALANKTKEGRECVCGGDPHWLLPLDLWPELRPQTSPPAGFRGAEETIRPALEADDRHGSDDTSARGTAPTLPRQHK